jgi:tRNA (cmo5U34)-methyltransferase
LEATHHGHEAASEHGHGHEPAADHGHEREHREDWNDEAFVNDWIERQKDRLPGRKRHFALIRSLITKTPDSEFSYLNIGAGPGYLDEVLLEAFPEAQATLVDGSLPMLGAARRQLERFGDRVEYVQANFANPSWAQAISGPFDFAVSTIAIHNLRDPKRIRELFGETFQLLGHGGLFLNLDYVRPARESLSGLGRWVAKDPEAGLSRSGGHDMPATMLEQLGWLNEAGFPCVEVPWKELNTVLFCALRDHLHLPEGADGHAAGGEHAHSH